MKKKPYIFVKAPEDYPGFKHRNKYVYEHHLVYWQVYKQVIKPGQIIRHKNNIKDDNRIENLELLDLDGHNPKAFMGKGAITFRCIYCNLEKTTMGNSYRQRLKYNKLGLFCSKRCAAIHAHNNRMASANLYE